MSPHEKTTQARPGEETSEYRLVKITAVVLGIIGLALLLADIILKAIGHKGLPGGTELGGSLLGTALPILGVGYAISRGLAKHGPLKVLLLGTLLAGATGCSATLAQRLGQAQTAAVGARKAATAYYDSECLARAKACPPKPAACPKLATCQADRHSVYRAAAGLQLAIKSVAIVGALDQAQGLAMLPGLVAKAGQLWAQVKKLTGDGLPSSLPVVR